MGSTIIFLVMFAVFVGILVSAGFYAKRWVSESSDYILAGREVSTFINMMGVSAIGFCGYFHHAGAGFRRAYGNEGVPLVGTYILPVRFGAVWLLFAGFIRKCGSQTLPEYLEMRYNGKGFVRSWLSRA